MKELCVVSKDRVGLLADISEILGKHEINIDSLSMQTSNDTAIIHLKVSKEKDARDLLMKTGFKVAENDHLVLNMKDRPGELAKISRLLANGQININNVHVMDERNNMKILALDTSDNPKAKKLLANYS